MNEMSLLERSFNSDRISQFAESLASSLDRQMKNAFRPDERKTLRLFSAREVSELTGISISNLNTRLADDPDFPQPVTDARGHRWFSAEKIDQIRDRMYATGKNVLTYRPGRQPGDALQVLSFVNFKGGSGKSTSSCHVAQRLALRGYRVLLIDADAQASATTMFGYRPEIEFQDKGTLYDCLRYDQDQVGIEHVIKKTYFHNLDLVPAGLVLSEYETNTAYALGQRISPTFAERLTIQLGRIEQNYDLVIIDCPPQLGFTTLTALAASSALVVTVVPSMLDIASMSQFLSLAGDLFRTIQHHTNRSEPISWNFVKFLLTRYEPSDGPQTQMAAYLRAILEDEVLTEPMLKSTAISDAGMTQQTVYEVDPGNFVKKTIERAVQSCNAVSDEIEGLIQRSWGRT